MSKPINRNWLLQSPCSPWHTAERCPSCRLEHCRLLARFIVAFSWLTCTQSRVLYVDWMFNIPFKVLCHPVGRRFEGSWEGLATATRCYIVIVVCKYSPEKATQSSTKNSYICCCKRWLLWQIAGLQTEVLCFCCPATFALPYQVPVIWTHGSLPCWRAWVLDPKPHDTLYKAWNGEGMQHTNKTCQFWSGKQRKPPVSRRLTSALRQKERLQRL